MHSKIADRLGVHPKGLTCVLGGFILCLSFASDFSYPNVNTYLTSYMRTTGYNPTLTYADFVFLSTTKTVVQGVSMPFIGDIARKIGCRPSIAIGSAIYSLGFMLTCLTIKYWFILAIISLACHGIGFSFVYATAIGAAQKWFPQHRKGLVGSLVVSGYGFGSLFWVPIQTAFVNPDNVKAVVDPNCTFAGTDYEQTKCELYFMDEDMLGRIPYMFLMLGVIFLVMGIISVILISEPEQQNQHGENNQTKEDKKSMELSEKGDQPPKTVISLSPLQVLKIRIFYQIWLGFFSIYMTNGLMLNYSKTFGLTFINDDHYYAKVAIFLNILNGLGRIAWGINYDRFGFKVCFTLIGLTVTVITSTLPLLPMIGENNLGVKLCYGLWMSVLYATFPGIYAIVAAGVNDAFGPVYYQSNFGLLFTQSLANCFVIMTLTKVSVIYSLLGYTGMFLVAGGFGLLGLIAVGLAPRHLESEKHGHLGKLPKVSEQRKITKKKVTYGSTSTA